MYLKLSIYEDFKAKWDMENFNREPEGDKKLR